MSIINLPGGAIWDDSKTLNEQTAAAQTYASDLLAAGEDANQTQTEYCFQDWQDNAINRPIKKVYVDAVNNLKIEEVFEYINPADNPATFAVKGRSYFLFQTV